MRSDQRPSSGNTLTDAAWIAANQQGRLGPGQQRLLPKPHNGCLLNLASLFWAPRLLGTCFYTLVGSAALFFPGPSKGPPPLLIALALLAPTVILTLLVQALIKAKQARFQRSADTVVVERAQGEIVWIEPYACYQARTPNFSLTTPGRGTLPAPGPYHFSYVAGAHLLVSAQPIHTFTQALALPGTLAATGLPGDEQARLALQLALCNALDFSLSDLSDNRLGRLGQMQRRKVSIGAHAAALWNGQPQSIEDALVLRQEGSDEDTVYYYDMGPEHFLVPEKARRALAQANGTRCRVFYLPSPKTLISVEVLEAPLR